MRGWRTLSWQAAAVNLAEYLDDIPWEDRNLIAHSHGPQPVLFACADGLAIRSLVSVCSPIRSDLEAIAMRPRPAIGSWLHLYAASWRDEWQRLGELGDGRFGWRQQAPLADVNQGVPGIGHGTLLNEPRCFPWWVEQGWIDCLAGA